LKPHGAMETVLEPREAGLGWGRVPFWPTATHDPITLKKGLWARREALEATLINPKIQI